MSNECGWVNGFSLFFDLGARGDMWSVIEGERGAIACALLASCGRFVGVLGLGSCV